MLRLHLKSKKYLDISYESINTSDATLFGAIAIWHVESINAQLLNGLQSIKPWCKILEDNNNCLASKLYVDNTID